MRPLRPTVVLATLATALTAALLGALELPSGRAAPSTRSVKTTRLTVLAGKPTEFRFKLSKQLVHRGIVVFKVVNRGTIPHDFGIRGKKTKLLARGKAATLRVAFTTPGNYPYLCTVPGHAAAGMRGILRVR